jgi:beta-lactamase class D
MNKTGVKTISTEFFFLLLIGILFSICLNSQEIKLVDFKDNFDEYGVEGCFVLYDQSNDIFICHNAERCDSGFLPASTFKIPNSVIALEENVVSDTNQIFKWDGKQWPTASWNRDQTLKSAMKHSCIWTFFQIAEKTGIEKYVQYLNAFNYGNKNPGGPPTRFWLVGDLRISAFQQLDFLRKFYHHELDVAKESIDIVKDIIILEKTADYRLSGKTGGTEISGNEFIMWLVGYIEMDKDVFFYALNFSSDDFLKTRHARLEITRSILKRIRLLK